MAPRCYDGCQSPATVARMKAITDAGQLTQEGFDLMGWTGRPGFMGTGNYTAGGRKPGYTKEAKVA